MSELISVPEPDTVQLVVPGTVVSVLALAPVPVSWTPPVVGPVELAGVVKVASRTAPKTP